MGACTGGPKPRCPGERKGVHSWSGDERSLARNNNNRNPPWLLYFFFLSESDDVRRLGNLGRLPNHHSRRPFQPSRRRWRGVDHRQVVVTRDRMIEAAEHIGIGTWRYAACMAGLVMTMLGGKGC
jgi:hypothetical protein